MKLIKFLFKLTIGLVFLVSISSCKKEDTLSIVVNFGVNTDNSTLDGDPLSNDEKDKLANLKISFTSEGDNGSIRTYTIVNPDNAHVPANGNGTWSVNGSTLTFKPSSGTATTATVSNPDIISQSNSSIDITWTDNDISTIAPDQGRKGGTYKYQLIVQ